MTNGAASASRARAVLRRRMAAEYAATMALTTVVALLGAPSLTDGLILVPGLLIAAYVLVTSWEHPPRPWLLAVSALAGVATMVWSALGPEVAGGAQGFAITAGIWVAFARQHRLWMAGAALVVVATCSLLAFLDPKGHPTSYLTTSVLLAAIWMAVIVYTREHWHLIGRFERAKDAEREVAVGAERHRFAADLHDIQGHTLHVIKLKAAVGARLLDTDPERARQELADIQELVAQTIDEGRRLAASTHSLALSAELANAVALFDAAGIATHVDHDDVAHVASTAGGPHDAALALVLREATTNALRHATARHVWISLDPTSLALTNDGVTVSDAAASQAPRRGLATLADRVHTAGGELEVTCTDGRFRVRAAFSTGAVR